MLFTLDGLRGALQADRFAAIREAVVLTTCNRVELYAITDTGSSDTASVLSSLVAQLTSMNISEFAEDVYELEGGEAALHLCRVAAGLESLVLGEQQILGQVTNAIQAAREHGVARDVLGAVFHTAVRTGKRARTETRINSNPVSMSSAAISYAQKRLGSLIDKKVLVVGLGEIGLLTLKALRSRNINDVAVANRTRSRAEAVAAEHGYQPYGLDELTTALRDVDVVITATSSTTPIIDGAALDHAMHDRNGRDLVVIDLAVPRNVAPDVASIDGVHVFDVDDMRGVLDSALRERRGQVPFVEKIIDDELGTLESEINGLEVKPLITDLRQKAEAIRQRELDRTLSRLDGADPQTVEHIHHLTRALVNKLLHEPTVRIREHADHHTTEYETVIRELFGLTEGR